MPHLQASKGLGFGALLPAALCVQLLLLLPGNQLRPRVEGRAGDVAVSASGWLGGSSPFGTCSAAQLGCCHAHSCFDDLLLRLLCAADVPAVQG